MAKLFYLCVLFASIQLISCRVARDTQSQAVDFSELVKKGEEALQDLNQKFLEIAGVKSNEELSAAVQNEGKKYVDKIKGLVDQLSAEATKADGVVQTIAARLGTAVDELKTYTETNPDLKKVQDEFYKNVETILKDTQEYGAKFQEKSKDISVDIEKVLKDIVDNTVETVKKVTHDVETAIKDKKD